MASDVVWKDREEGWTDGHSCLQAQAQAQVLGIVDALLGNRFEAKGLRCTNVCKGGVEISLETGAGDGILGAALNASTGSWNFQPGDSWASGTVGGTLLAPLVSVRTEHRRKGP